MEENGNIFVDISMDGLIGSLQELKRQFDELKGKQEGLKEAFDAGKISAEEYAKATIENTQQQKVLRQEMGQVEKSIQNEIKAQKAQEGSLVQLRAQLANLNKQYDSMSGFERLGVEGQKLQERIKGLSDQILNLEGNTGRWQRNVGNYQSALQGLSGNFKAAGLSTKGLDQSLKLLNGNPIMLLLTAIVTVGRQITQAFKGNEEATMALRQAFSAFNPIIDAAKRGLESMAKVVVNVVTAAVSGLTTAIGWLLDKVQQVGNFFGADWHMGDNFREGVAAAKELQTAENDYIKAKRAWSVESAKIDKEVADLREKAADKENYTAKQRLEYLDRAIALETKKAEKDKELAQQNLRNLQLEAQRSANDAAMNDRLAEAERAVIEADTRLSDTKRNLNRQRQQAVKEINGVTAATKANTEAVKDNTQELERQADEYRKKTLEEMQKAEDALNNIIEDAFEKRRKIEETRYQRQHDALLQSMVEEEEAHGNKTDLYKAYMEQWEALETEHQQAMLAIKEDEAAKEQAIEDAKQAKMEETAAKAKAIEKARLDYSTQIASSLSSLMEAVAGDNEEMVKAAKVVALAEVAIKQGVAIASAVASAAQGDPYTYALRVAVAIASTVAAMAQAIASINKSGFERGGVIGGYHGATMGRDNTYIAARQGEMVINANQQRQLFDIANGGGFATTNMAAELAAAIREMPAPILEYSEFSQFSDRVAALNELSKLK